MGVLEIFVYGFLIFYGAILLIYLRRVFLDITDPSKTVAWIMVLIFIPIIGLVFYRVVGRNQRKEKYFKKYLNFEIETDTEMGRVTSEDYAQLSLLQDNIRVIRLLERNSNAFLRKGNRIKVLQNGESFFTDLFSQIERAKHSVHLDFYIVCEGEVAEHLLGLITQKVKENVKVRLVYDAFGSFTLSRKFIQRVKSSGAEIKEFMPIKLGKMARHLNYRNHRKIVVIDNRIGYTGGMNIGDVYLKGDPNLGFWRDTFVKIEGPSVLDLQYIFLLDWYMAGGEQVPRFNLLPEVYDDDVPVQIINSGPDSDFASIMQQYFTIITDASEYVYISTPYFVPGKPMIDALTTAAMCGVDIRMLLPYASDSKWLKWCMMSFLQELLDAGVRVYFYQKGFLHSKVIIADDNVISIGTANMDERSFKSNFEVNAMVYDEEICTQLKNDFFTDLSVSEELKANTYPTHKDRHRTLESFARLTSPLL